jgi:hypothetical protein
MLPIPQSTNNGFDVLLFCGAAVIQLPRYTETDETGKNLLTLYVWFVRTAPLPRSFFVSIRFTNNPTIPAAFF